MPQLTQSERTELSDERMIRTTLRLIVQHGIAGVRLTEVGLRAGYSRGLAAMRFGTKASLLSRVVRHATSGWMQKLSEAVNGKSGINAVCAAIDAQGHWMIEAPEEMRVLYLIFFQSLDPGADYHFAVERMLAAQRRDMARWIREAGEESSMTPAAEAEFEAEQILASMVGLIYQSLVDSRADVKRMHARLKGDVLARLSSKQKNRYGHECGSLP